MSKIFVFLFFPIWLFAQHPKREFRAVWVASVLNIDFPSAKGLPSSIQQRHFRWLVEQHQLNGMNALMVQIRPAADALYASKYEPWSEFLTGEQGKAPEPYYDPLTFMIEETHQKGMEFHAWLNPYRASMNGKTSANHITKKHPEWFIDYGGKKIFNPGLPQVRQYIVDVILDIIQRYDVDGIHLDDYFYPYRTGNQDFADHHTFQQYGQGFEDKAAWRRNNIDLLIYEIHKAIQNHKKHIRFGVSPFGVWRNQSQDAKGSPTASSMTCYDDLHADVLVWLKKSWIDYIIPQIYFEINHPKVDYAQLTDWWTKQNFVPHLYIGHGVYKASPTESKTWDSSELPRQIRFNRQYAKIQGSAFFSSKSLTRNYANFQDSLRQKIYPYPALVPSSPWKDATPPLPAESFEVISVESGNLLFWKTPAPAKDKDLPAYYVIYRFEKGEKQDLNKPENILTIYRKSENIFLDKNLQANKTYDYLITSLDRLHNESMPQIAQSTPSPVLPRASPTEKTYWYDFVRAFWKIYWQYQSWQN